MPSQLPNGNFQFRAERFWYFPKDEINQLNQYKANFRAPKIELQKGLLVYGKSGRLNVNNLFILFDKFDIEAENIFTKHGSYSNGLQKYFVWKAWLSSEVR